MAAGLISNADYVSFVNQGTSITTLSSNKITSSAASIAQTLGYVPAASGAPLTLDEVTSALGYTPASASASSKWTASGTAIHYLGGNVGIGTSSPNRRFEVWSGSGLAAFNGSVSNHGYLELYTDMNNPTARTAYMGFPTSGSKTLAIYSQIASGSVQLQNVNGVLHMAHNGLVGVGSTNPTARLHIISGTATAASLKFDQSTLLASPQAGAVEYDGTSLYYTDNTNTRRMLASSSGTVDASNLNSAGNITMTPTGSVIVSSTTASTNSQTGALIVKGGVGITGNLFSSGTIITSNNIQGLVVTATSGIISPLVAGSSLASGNLQLESTLILGSIENHL